MEDDFFDQDDLGGNIFDDDALDYILYEECERDAKKNSGAGCLGMIMAMIFVPTLVTFLFHWSCL